ncbi:MAG TPA: hypothetical protein VGQ17_14370 [Gemmatimonadales bacterium]|jgi:hypothetical protein|nr:hypothetical protein [Gemmatimonadales bacterium]
MPCCRDGARDGARGKDLPGPRNRVRRLRSTEHGIRARSRDGFVLAMMIFALTIGGLLVLLSVDTTRYDRDGARNLLEGTRSFYAAEAGLSRILSDWRALQYDTLVPAPGQRSDLGWTLLPGSRSRYRAVLLRLVPSGPILLTVEGRSGAPREGLRTVSRMVAPGPPAFNWAAFGRNDVKVSGTGTGTDSYDSSLGPYGLGNQGSDGDVASDGAISLLSGASLIKGDASAVTSIDGGCANPRITGTCTLPAPLVPLPNVSCPAGMSPAGDIPSGPGISYNAGTGDLTVSKAGGVPQVLTLPFTTPSGKPYRFHDLTLTGGGKLNFSGTPAHVDVYLSGTFTPSGGIIVNGSGSPRNLAFWGCGTSTTGWLISGGSGAAFTLYAPNHNVTLSGAGDIYGSLIAASVTLSGGSVIHYDKALAGLPTYVPVPGSWTEISN